MNDIELGDRVNRESRTSVQSDIAVDCDRCSPCCSSYYCSCKKIKVFSLITHMLNTLMIGFLVINLMLK